jgi:propionyl-CoA synthetase
VTQYDEVYRRSLEDPEGFWAEAAASLHWHRRWDRVLDVSERPNGRWFAGGELSTCWNALDRHVDGGRGGQTALIWDSPVTGQVRTYTYAELRDQVARAAGALRALGVERGDRVILYLPMVPEAAIGMLACARIGAIHSVVFGGFAPRELATRIDDAKPKVILSASCGIEGQRVIAYKPLLDAAIELASWKPERVVVLQRDAAAAGSARAQPERAGSHAAGSSRSAAAPGSGAAGTAVAPAALVRATLIPGRDLDWQDWIAAAASCDCVPLAATDPLYILYTSGTTGRPKGVVRDHGGHAVALAWSMRNVYGVEPGEVFWAASDVGWVVGHSYIVYAPLLHGATTILYEGKPVGTPDAGAFWRVIAQHGVAALFTAPTAFRAIKREDPRGEHLRRHDLSRFRTLFLAGERADPDTLRWAEQLLGVPVIDHWWQTETGWPMAANCVGLGMLPIKHGSPTKAVPGYDIRVVDERARDLPPGETGALVVKLPLPPGCLPTLWQNDAGFASSYLEEFPGFYKTADAGFRDQDGYLYVMSRTDDIINVAGHRLSTGGMEEVLAAHPDVAECAVIGVADALKGQVPVGLVVLKAGVARPHSEIARECVQAVRDSIGAVASFKQATVVERLPKTRSGKVLRSTMRRIADGEEWRAPATIDDAASLDEIAAALAKLGYPSSG